MRYFLICLALEFLPPSAPKGVAAWSAWTVVGFSVWPLPIRQGALVSAERVGTGEGPHRQSRGHSDQSCVTKARAWGESLLSRVPQRGDGVQEDLCPKGEVTPGSASGWAAKTHGMGLGHVPEPYGVPGVSRALWGFLAPRGGVLGAPQGPSPNSPTFWAPGAGVLGEAGVHGASPGSGCLSRPVPGRASRVELLPEPSAVWCSLIPSFICSPRIMREFPRAEARHSLITQAQLQKSACGPPSCSPQAREA